MSAAAPARTHRLWLVAAIFVAIVGVILLIALQQAAALSDVRAYTTGEGLYSKAQKRAVISLLRYARSRAEREYLAFEEAIRVPIGDRDARLALLQPRPDLEAAARAFMRGRNHPDDVAGMARFFLRFQDVTYVAEAIRIWTEGDAEVARLVGLGAELKRAVDGRAPAARIDALLAEIVAVDDRLTRLEDQFSDTLGEGARFVSRVMMQLLLLVSAVLIAFALLFTLRMVRQLERSAAVLRQSEARYRALSENMVDGLLILQHGRFVHANRSALALLGYPLQDLLGREFAPIVHPDHRALVVERHRRRSAGEQLEPRYDIQVVTRSGAPQWVQIANALVEWEGRPALLTVIGDIAERKRLEEALRGVNEALELRVAARTAELETLLRELETFNYTVAHDLRTPLSVISNYAGMVIHEFGAALPQDGKRMLERISESAVQMVRLLEDLLAFARLGQQPVQRAAVDMADLAGEVAAELQRTEAGRRSQVSVSALPACQGDRALLRQVWANLLANAAKYSRRRDPAVLELGYSAESAAYYVRDNGIGFDMQYADKLFGVFQRLHADPQYEGTGLGLAITARIVQRHGGRIWARARPEEGATFYFTIP